MAVTEDRALVLSEELRVANATIVELTAANEALQTRIGAVRTSERRLRAQITTMRKSFSWRSTFVFRAVWRLLTQKRS